MKVFRSTLICNLNTKLLLVALVLMALVSAAAEKPLILKRQVVAKVEIEGNRAFSDGKIKSFLYTRQNSWYNFISKRKISPSNLVYDVDQIKKFYAKNGYLFTTVDYKVDYTESDSNQVAVLFTIEEGKRVFAQSVATAGGLPQLASGIEKYIRKIKTGIPINDEAVKAAVFKIMNFYAENAYPIANIKAEYRYNADSTRADIVFNIDPKEYVLNGEVTIVTGDNNVSKDYVIRREILVKPGEPYDKRKIIESQQRLYATGLLKFVTLRRTLDMKKVNEDTVYNDFRLVINERKPYFISFKTGASQDVDYNAVFTTSASWGNRNLWGTGRKLILTLSNSMQLTKSGSEITNLTFSDFKELEFEPVKNSIGLEYVEPWFLNYRLPLSQSLTYEPRNKSKILKKYYDRYSSETSLSRELDAYTNIQFSVNFNFVDFRDVKTSGEEEYIRQIEDNTERRQLSLYGQRDTRDNILAPQKGSYSYAYVDYVGDLLGGDFSYIKTEFYWSRFNNFTGENILATRIDIGFLHELKSGGSGSDDRFMLGGAKTIRGFGENDLGPIFTEADGVDSTQSLYHQAKGGKFMLMTNLELRRPLFWRFGGTAFVDIGNLFDDVSDFKLNLIEVTPGLGLQFFTPIGPIRIDWAVPLKKEFDLAGGAWHFTILYAF